MLAVLSMLSVYNIMRTTNRLMKKPAPSGRNGLNKASKDKAVWLGLKEEE
jgi:hypothetical protein